MAEKCREKYGGESHLVRVPVPGVDTAVLVIKLHSAGDSLAEGEACNTQIQLSSSVAQSQLFLPEVSVLAVPSLAQSGSVTCLATRDFLDLISGKELDMVMVELQMMLRED